MRRSLRGGILLALFTLAAGLGFAADPGGRGAITGRVLNPATNEYVSNAEVQLVGTNRTVASDQGGYYRFDDVPAGSVTVQVIYTGYKTETAAVNVAPGVTATHDFELHTTQRPADGETIKLDAFTVSTEREGNAKAIMAQRNSMNITNSVSADVFGTTSEGNVGEFLKYLPGVDLEYVEADTRTPRLGALDPSYTGVTMNGLGIASADAFQQANGTDNVRAGGGNRSFGFEQVSINSIESIEINQTVSADQDANAPAGLINLVTKKAFDRKQRYIGYSANVTANSEDPTFQRTYGPGDTRDYKLRPGGTLDYYDSFLNHRVGVVFNVSESNMFNQQRLIQLGYNNTTTATDTRPHVLNSFTFKSGPKFTERFSVYGGVDFKATPDLTLSLSSGYQWYSAQYFNRQISVTGARANITGDGLTDFSIINDNASIGYGGAQASKKTRSYQLVPSFEYRHGPLRLTGAVNYSTSVNSYGALAARKNSRDVPVNSLTGIDLHIVRANPTVADFTIAQIAGTTAASTSAAKDASNFANFTNPRVVDDGRYNGKNIYQGMIDATYAEAWTWPTVFKAGAKITETSNANDDYTPIYTWNYIGPGGGATGSWAGYPSPTTWDMGVPNIRFVNLAGQPFIPTFANRNLIANTFYDHPEWFVNNSITPTNWYNAIVGNHRRIREQVNAAYLMGTTTVRRLSLRAGLRAEETVVTSVEFDPRSAADVKAAGFTTDATGRANTVPGLIYQYTSQPKVTKVGRYTTLFPSASAKYSIRNNLQAQLGYSHTIRRPNYNDVGGVAVIDESNSTISIPNPGLLPEISDNVAARLSYYFEPVGNLSFSAFANRIKNAVSTVGEDSSGTEFGTDYPGFQVQTRSNTGGTAEVKGWTADYRQNLGFLPSMFSGTTVFANVTRSVVDPVKKWGVPPWMASAGVSFRVSRFYVGVNAKWTDDTPWNFVEGRFRKHRIMEDVNFGFRVNKYLNLFLNGRNITNEPDYVYDFGNSSYIQKIEHYGSIWTFGVSGNF